MALDLNCDGWNEDRDRSHMNAAAAAAAAGKVNRERGER
jgi:hypothetical protein